MSNEEFGRFLLTARYGVEGRMLVCLRELVVTGEGLRERTDKRLCEGREYEKQKGRESEREKEGN